MSANEELSKIDFSSLILGFSSAALSYLGISPNGESSAASSSVNLILAEQNIEIIALLAEKTRGNLTPEESHLIQSVLADLRLKYVAAKKS